MVRGEKRDTQPKIRSRLELWSRSLKVDRGLQVFAESRAAVLLGGFFVDELQMSVEAQGPVFRSRVRVEAKGHAVVGVEQAPSVRQAIIGALGRAKRALARSIERSQARRRRWQHAVGLSLLLGSAGFAQACATGASNASFTGPSAPETRQLVLQVHASGGEPDATKIDPTSDAAWQPAPTRPAPTVVAPPMARKLELRIIPHSR